MAKVLKTQEIRDLFLSFFEERGHRRVPSSPLIPTDDPTLLFTSAGMVQFKPLYASRGTLEYTRATSVQKCFRATDLERVGHTPRHLTFFEMLGNFSFGDYFKREAIHWAWEFSVQVLEMDPEVLWVSVYLDDDEAAEIWEKEVGVPAERIVRLGKADNFWGPAGTSGACGPSSEIYMDLGPQYACGRPDCKPGCECDRYQEFWNLVFPQFHQAENGELSPLPRKGIDTGLGLERLAQLLQNKPSVFEIDEFLPLRDAVADLTRVDMDREDHRTALNVISEHARAVTMLFNEGVYPSNEGRGYVARRILRRAARRGLALGIREPFLYKLTGVVVDTLSRPYPELLESRDRVAKVCRAEETRFLETLEIGLRRFEEVAERTRAEKRDVISGRDLFTLYDTFGFPPDMTSEMAAEIGLGVDEEGFHREMEKQVERSRATAQFDGPTEEEAAWEWLAPQDAPHSRFVGYDVFETEVRVVARRPAGDQWEFLLDVTPFYAEGGGQVGDRGRLLAGGETVVELTGVVRRDGLHVHRGRVPAGGALPETPLVAQVDLEARRGTERNHTATHLLQAALKAEVGDHVTQAGSLVAPDRLRFDFNHFSALTPAQIRAVEDHVNRAVLADRDVHKEVTTMAEARRAGAIAMFGEKYGDTVRQVFVTDEDGGNVSRELCGGCHVRRTGEIGVFRILSEESVAAGIRRVEAATGWNAVRRFRDEDEMLHRVEAAVKAGSVGDIEARVHGVVEDNERLKKELARMRSELLNQSSGDILDRVEQVDGVPFLAAEFPVSDVKALREAADKLRDRMRSGVGLLAARTEDKVALLAFVTDDLVQRGLRADVLVREAAGILGGGGGGRPQLATAGGKDPEKIPEALRHGREVLAKMLAGEKAGA
jgi:alanyl-tRNA synthetase